MWWCSIGAHRFTLELLGGMCGGTGRDVGAHSMSPSLLCAGVQLSAHPVRPPQGHGIRVAIWGAHLEKVRRI